MCLRYFFDKKYFGFNYRIYEIARVDLVDYFDYLNHKSDISIKTKITKWSILKSFLQFCMEYYDDFSVIIPKRIVNWKRKEMMLFEGYCWVVRVLRNMKKVKLGSENERDI